MRNINSIEPETFEFQPELGQFEGAFGEFESDLETDTGEFEGAFGEFETPGAQKNWYYFDAWWRSPNGSQKQLAKYGPRQETEADGSRLFDTFCLTHQNNSSSQGAGKLLVRCYQWLPVSSRWIACKSVVGFRRGMCTSDESELDEFESGAEEFESSGTGTSGGRRRGVTFLRRSRGLRIRQRPSAGRQSPAMRMQSRLPMTAGRSTAMEIPMTMEIPMPMEGEVGFDSPTRAPRQVRPNFVRCNAADPAVTAITGADPVAAITQANTRAIEMLDNAINQLQTARAQVRGGAAPVAPAVPNALRDALQLRFGMNAGTRALWTSSAARSFLTIIRRLRGARQILADGAMRYICLAPSAPARVTLGSGANSCNVVGCEGEIGFSCGGVSTIAMCRPWWRNADNTPTSVEVRASSLVHEAIHIYFGFIVDSGNFINAHCYQHLVLDLNGVAVPPDRVGACPLL